MAQFRGLSDIIKEQISKNTSNGHTHPSATETATLVGQNLGLFADIRPTAITGVFRWGYSTWGVDTIIGVGFPEDSY
jgi:hypothetical protein